MSTAQPSLLDNLDSMQIEAHSSRLNVARPSPPIFDGETFDPQKDETRLSTQLAGVFNLMSDGSWRTLQEIGAVVPGSEAGLSARLRDLRKTKWGSHAVNRRRRTEGTFEYQVVVRERTAA